MTALPAGCVRHREHVAALADSELRYVPWRSRLHIRRCVACHADLEAQRTLTKRIREAVGMPAHHRVTFGAGRRRPWAVAALVSTLIAGLVAAGVVVRLGDTVSAAVAAAAQNPTMRASDPVAVGDWCVETAGQAPPVVSLATLTLMGARMDSLGGGSAVTVYYTNSDGAEIAVTWVNLTANVHGMSDMENRSVAGHAVVVLRDGPEMVVVSGAAPAGTLYRTAAAIAAGLAGSALASRE